MVVLLMMLVMNSKKAHPQTKHLNPKLIENLTVFLALTLEKPVAVSFQHP